MHVVVRVTAMDAAPQAAPQKCPAESFRPHRHICRFLRFHREQPPSIAGTSDGRRRPINRRKRMSRTVYKIMSTATVLLGLVSTGALVSCAGGQGKESTGDYVDD